MLPGIIIFRCWDNADPQRDSIFTQGPADVLDHVASEMAIGSKRGADFARAPECDSHSLPPEQWRPIHRCRSHRIHPSIAIRGEGTALEKRRRPEDAAGGTEKRR